MTAQAIMYLKKTYDIQNSRLNYIEDLCCDNKGHLYIADSAANRIFVYQSNMELLRIFGGIGQGPGEFLAEPHKAFLRISAGNDGNIYITDTGNIRLSVFSGDGIFLKDYAMPRALLDRPVISSKGDIYMLLDSGDKLIGRYDSDMVLKKLLFEKKKHLNFQFGEPEDYLITVNDSWLKKLITRTDDIILVSNASLSAHIIGPNDESINRFSIINTTFMNDFKKRMGAARSKHLFVLPFNAGLDRHSNIIYLSYYNESLDNFEYYRYKIDGTLLDILRFSVVITSKFCVAGDRLYIVMNESRIGVFDLNKQGGN